MAIVAPTILAGPGPAFAASTPTGPAFSPTQSLAVTQATTYTFGQQPLADVLAAAGAQTKCDGLTQNQLAAMMLAPTYPETGATGALSPSPMTLSRYDSVSVNSTNANLYFQGNVSTPFSRAFWNPGVGAWQFDSAGGWNLSTAQEMSTDSAAATAAQVMATRWCNDTADVANPAARRTAAWAPWGGCATNGTCESIYQTIFDPATLHVATDASVTRFGGMVPRTCQIAAGTSVFCVRVDPAQAQGNAAFAKPAFGPTPISAPFYNYILAGREHRVWLKDDTGYPMTIDASLQIGHNARTSLTWTTGDVLCDATVGLGACGPQLFLRTSNTSGVADLNYSVLMPKGGKTLMCDWNGDGTDTPGVVKSGVWSITNSTTGGVAQQVFGYGNATDIPVCGDWDGNGTDTPGLVRNGVWYLVNSLGKPTADISFGYGNPSGDIPVVGDWDGNGTDTPGLVRNGSWFLVNSSGKGSADLSFGYGNPSGDIPVVGDWDGNGTDTPGLVRNGAWYLTNTAGKGIADVSFFFGDAGDAVVTGRWSPGAPTTIGVVR